VQQTRPSDWGAREQHPLYKSWLWHKSKAVNGIVREWADDFWKFVETVGERPAGHRINKIIKNMPLGPNNWEWRETIPAQDKAKYSREWRKANPDKAKNIDLKKRFGIGLDEYDAILKKQKYACAICQQNEMAVDEKGRIRMMPVDHCHNTGKIRGILCTACNMALGRFKDNPEILRKAAEYVEYYAALDNRT
jgi:hypothetical protein